MLFTIGIVGIVSATFAGDTGGGIAGAGGGNVVATGGAGGGGGVGAIKGGGDGNCGKVGILRLLLSAVGFVIGISFDISGFGSGGGELLSLKNKKYISVIAHNIRIIKVAAFFFGLEATAESSESISGMLFSSKFCSRSKLFSSLSCILLLLN
ncbi:MAG: hypothetical protein AB8U25_05190 [Rickettsiales endosymbiont of Dermacentor nuttalli]